MTLKEQLGIRSFSALIGTQPRETCPMIDDHISDLNREIDDLRSDISAYENEIQEEENSEEPDNSKIKSTQSKIEKLESEIYSLQDKINYLESDRNKIREARSIGEANRKHVLSLFEKNLKHVNNKIYLNIKDIKNNGEGLDSCHFSNLDSSYLDVEKNYRLIIDWAIAWDQAAENILNDMNSSIIQIDLDKKQEADFFNLLSDLEKFVLNVDLQNVNMINKVKEFFPDVIYHGNAYKKDKKLFKVPKENSENIEIYALDIDKLWQNYFSYLEMPDCDYLEINF